MRENRLRWFGDYFYNIDRYRYNVACPDPLPTLEIFFLVNSTEKIEKKKRPINKGEKA